MSRTPVHPTSLTAFNDAESVDGQIGMGTRFSASSRVNLKTTGGRIISVPADNTRVFVTTTSGKEDVYWPPIQVHFIDSRMKISGYNGSGSYGQTDIKKVEVKYLE